MIPLAGNRAPAAAFFRQRLVDAHICGQEAEQMP